MSDSFYPKLVPELLTDRRREWRAPLSGLVSSHNAAANFLGRACDISCSGLAIEGNIHPPQGAFLTLQFNLPGTGDPLFCQGIVVRSHAPGKWAVEFIRTDEAPNAAQQALQQVESFIDRHRLTGNA